MDRRRLTIALLAALVLSGAVTFFLNRKISIRNGAAVPQTMQKYVAANRLVQPGEALKADSLILIDWPAKLGLEGGFTKVEDLAGRAVIYPIAARQPILQAYLAVPGSGIGLTVKIPEGMRATSVRSDEIVGVAGFLFPGAHVDVLVTFRSDADSVPETQIVLQDVEVLTVGQRIEPEPGGKAETVGVVTVLLTAADAQKVALSISQGSIHFALRNGADRGHIDAVPVSVAQLTGKAGQKVPSPNADGSGFVPKKPTYVVETILGDKRATAEFEH
ncbi:MAG TPA: Flp pilus assembly protein CpaB [Terriglobales bacterium]|jgi:pilus assembly protein CpaB